MWARSPLRERQRSGVVACARLVASRVFEKYEIVRRIAVGGMGEVFLARQLGAAKFERQVILKAMLSEKATPLLASRFLDEARLVATLNHPNVVSVFEAGLSDGTFYMAMEYIAGWNLAQLQREASASEVPLPLGLVVRVVHDAALGLDHAHHAVDAQGRLQQIVHRDVSPHNIMLRRDGVTKVVDFGVAWALNRDAKTQTGAVVGKVAYMAPEQLMGEATDARTDQFALGVVAWELLTRRRLYVAVNDVELAKLVLTARIPHPCDVAPEVPRALGDVVMRMLCEAPDRRFSRLQDVAIEFDRVARTLTLDTSSATVEAFLAPWLPVPAERVEDAGSNFVVQLRPQPATPERVLPEQPATVESPRARPLPTVRDGSERPPMLELESPAAAKHSARNAVAAAGLALLALVAAVGFVITREAPEQLTSTDAGVIAAVETPARQQPDAGVTAALEPPARQQPDAGVTAALEPAAPDAGGAVAATPAPPTIDAGLVASASPARNKKTKKKEPAKEPVVAAAAPEAPRSGVLNLDTDPWSKVYVDGRFVGSTPLSTELRSGPHELVLVNAERELRKGHHFTLAAGETLKLKLTLEQLGGAP